MTSIVDGDGEPRPELPAHPALRHDGRRGGRPRKLRVPVRHPGQDRLSPVPGAPRMGTDLSASWAWVAESMRSAASSTWGSIPTALAGKGLLILAAPALLFATGFFERGGDHAAQDPGRGLPAERHRSGRGGRREMTRILFLIDELDVGGTEQQLLELVKRLDRQRYEPVVCCFRPGRSPRRSRPRASGSSRSKARQGRSRLRREARPDDAAGADRPAADLPLHREHLGTTGRTPRRGPDHRDAPSGTSTCGKSGTSSGSGVWLDRWTQRTIGNSQAVGDYLAAKGIAREAPRDLQRRGYQPLRGAADAACRARGVRHPPAPRGRRPPGPARAAEGSADVPRRGGHRRAEDAERVLPRGRREAFRPSWSEKAHALGLGGRIVFTGPRRDVAAPPRRLRHVRPLLGEGGNVEHHHGVDGGGQADGGDAGRRQSGADAGRGDGLPRLTPRSDRARRRHPAHPRRPGAGQIHGPSRESAHGRAVLGRRHGRGDPRALR